ncbi:MAG: right-handed parallel beta-helix repeat-containing protein [Pseudomonadota bacterium]
MARYGWARILGGAILTALSLTAAHPLAAASGAQTAAQLNDLRIRLADLDEALETDPRNREVPLAELLHRHGLDRVASRLAAEERASEIGRALRVSIPDTPAIAEKTDLRLVLTLLSQSYTTNDNRDVLFAAGPDDTMVQAFRGGEVTLGDLERAGVLRPAEGAVPAELIRPIVLWEDTRLRLSAGETLALSRPGGAFIISLGYVEIHGAELVVAGGENRHSADFVPFLTIGGGGALSMIDSTVRGLGFGWTQKFSGVSILAHPFMPPIGGSQIIRSHFDEIVTLVLAGTPDVRVMDNRFHDVRDNALRLARSPRARVQGNLFFGDGPTNAIRLLDGTSDAVMSGNLLLGGDRAGILIGRGSNRVRVVGNVIWRRDGAAIKFDRTDCGYASLNIALDGRQKGIELRQSPGMVLHRNLISGAHSSAIWISAQPHGAVTRVTDNILSGNGEGFATATARRLALVGNDLTAQMPRLVSGDLVPQNAAIAMDLKGRKPMLLSAGGPEHPPQLPQVCGSAGRP